MDWNQNRAPIANGYQQLGAVAATGLTVPPGTSFAIITVEGQPVRWRDDGVNPTATVGYPLAVGQELRYTAAQLSVIKFIQQSATATINVSYYS